MAFAAAALIVLVGFKSTASGLPLVSKLPAPTHPLWKPEPGFLLTDSALDLSPKQRREIQAIQEHWQSDRQPLLTAMASFRPHEGNEIQVKEGLQDYSELSRRFDGVRASYWTSATALLAPGQVAKIPGDAQ